MARAAPRVGDSHNFGRRVRVAGERVVKPRTVLWEWLVLSPQSPLRRALARAAAESELGREAFEFLPRLKFWRWRGQPGGEVERLSLAPLPRTRATREELAQVLGRALALFSWLGLADLHWENLALGAGPGGRVVFGPLDIELMLADLALPTETKLLPDADPEYAEICRHAAGARRALPWLGKPIAPADLLRMVLHYRATLELLSRHAPALARAIASVPQLKEAPLRVLLRGTEEYVRTPEHQLWPPLLEAEREQLERGDVPYFFRLYGRAGIHYFTEPSLVRRGRLPLHGDVPQLDPILSLSKHLRSPKREKLLRDGVMAVLAAFDHPSLNGRQQHAGLAVTFGARSLVVRLPNGEELRSRRDLRAFVGSLYLPCRCGETRAVLVPPVTVCRAAPRSV